MTAPTSENLTDRLRKKADEMEKLILEAADQIDELEAWIRELES